MLEPWDRADADALADFLTAHDWPFHAGGPVDRAAVLGRVAAGWYDGPEVRTFWVADGGSRAGLVRLYDLADENVEFDLRLAGPARGRGLGTAAVRELTGWVFGTLPHVERIEATTRADNRAMRRVLARCGYVQEARYRLAWPTPDGRRLDSVGYAVLRPDLAAGPVLADVAAVVVDCAAPGPVARFWAAARGGEVVRTDPDAVTTDLGGTTVVFRAVPGFRPPTWPSAEVPLHAHVDWYVDDLAAAEAELVRLGATPAPLQAHRADGLVVLLDPAGHPFCIGTRP